MFFLISFTLSHQINITSNNSIKSLVLYLHPRHCIEVSVSSELQTYFSDMREANGLTLEIQTNKNSIFGPFNHRSHLDGIDFQKDYTDYKLTFTNEGDYYIQLAIVFGENLKASLNTINHNLSNFKFPISNYPSKQFTYFYNSGLIFHEKKYSSVIFIALPIALAVIFIFVCIIGKPSVFENCYTSKRKVSNSP